MVTSCRRRSAQLSWGSSGALNYPSQWVCGEALMETHRVKPLKALEFSFLKTPTLTQTVFFFKWNFVWLEQRSFFEFLRKNSWAFLIISKFSQRRKCFFSVDKYLIQDRYFDHCFFFLKKSLHCTSFSWYRTFHQ